jgi:hypothetical protein
LPSVPEARYAAKICDQVGAAVVPELLLEDVLLDPLEEPPAPLDEPPIVPPDEPELEAPDEPELEPPDELLLEPPPLDEPLPEPEPLDDVLPEEPLLDPPASSVIAATPSVGEGAPLMPPYGPPRGVLAPLHPAPAKIVASPRAKHTHPAVLDASIGDSSFAQDYGQMPLGVAQIRPYFRQLEELGPNAIHFGRTLTVTEARRHRAREHTGAPAGEPGTFRVHTLALDFCNHGRQASRCSG